MAGPAVIRAEALGKKYSIGHQAERGGYVALRDVLARKAKRLARSMSHFASGDAGIACDEVETFWALRDLEFDIGRGEVVGVIGRNGAGKSTLLKILSRITEPSEGRVTIKGRVASLLEVGTGFHPELTGRENIDLNGAILGMTRAEIRRKFDEIVAFSEVERFLDTPVKRYSSGMYTRLAFAVAAHLEAEILVVDEILSVGDADFQRKCLGKMSEVATGGRTVLFVSHNMASVRQLCGRAIHLSAGRMIGAGDTAEQVEAYLAGGAAAATVAVKTASPRDSDLPHIEEVLLPSATCNFGETLQLDLSIRSNVPARVGVELEIHDERGVSVAYVSIAPMLDKPIVFKSAGQLKVSLTLGPLPLATGRYAIYLWLTQPWVETFHVLQQPVRFDVIHSDPGGTGFDFRQGAGRGSITIPMRWTIHA